MKTKSGSHIDDCFAEKYYIFANYRQNFQTVYLNTEIVTFLQVFVCTCTSCVLYCIVFRETFLPRSDYNACNPRGYDTDLSISKPKNEFLKGVLNIEELPYGIIYHMRLSVRSYD